MKLDLSQLFHTSIGFDHLNRFLEEFSNKSQASVYPPYNILKISEDNYRISIALAGFMAEDIEITLKEMELRITSKGIKNDDKIQYLYKGIANRAFEKKYQLAENIKISGASLKNGMLSIDLKKTPPLQKKAQKIEIIE